MTTPSFALFETPLGTCGIAWGERGVVGLQLPEASASATRERLARRFPGAREAPPPAAVRRVQRDLVALLRGRPRDLSGVELDLRNVPPFHRRVYEAARAIPPGATVSYGEIAAKIGAPGAARAVGQALGRNPFPIVVPCHRVLAAGGRLGGFSANGGAATKRRMLEIEGAGSDGPPGAGVASGRGARRKPPASGSSDAARRKPPVSRSADALAFDPAAAARKLRAADPHLGRAIDAIGPCRLEEQIRGTRSVFAALSEAIVYQQLSGKAAATIHGRVCALFSNRGASPTPAQILGASDEALRGAGLSRAKLLALRDLAQRTESGDVPTLAVIRRMTDEEVIERLTAVRGIGRWTAEMLLMFRLGRPDVLPVDDYGVRKGFAVVLRRRELPSPREVGAYGERWAPWRTVASWYLWRAADRGGL